MRVPVAALATALTGALVATALAATAWADDEPVRPRIIGGDTATSAPWAAAVLGDANDGHGAYFRCTGTVIAPTWVLTADHCDIGTLTVRTGSLDRTRGGTVTTVTDVVTRHDLALLRLASPVDATHLRLADTDPPVTATNTLFGWGATCKAGCESSEVLKVATVEVTDVADPLKTDYRGGPAIESRAVTGNAWSGDSGGPQIHDGEQVGVASTADGDSRQYYSSVAASRDWIRTVAGV